MIDSPLLGEAPETDSGTLSEQVFRRIREAIVRGDVEFRDGDGMKLPVPDGPVEIEVAEDSVTLSWTQGQDAGSTAMMR